MGSVRIGVDIGGTFTDITVLEEDTGRMTIAKVPSRRGDPGGALLDAIKHGLGAADVNPAKVTLLIHGSTLITNAVLENKLPKTTLLTTSGFRDILEIGRHFRPDMYDLQQDRSVPIVPRERRIGVNERTAANGEILLEPDPAELRKLIANIREGDAEAVAICFLNSYVNPSNEATVRDWLAKEVPELAVSASCDICPEMREYERMSTVVLNAAAMPLVAKYLSEITPRVRGKLPNAKILLMQSSGGSLTVEAAKKFPARLITSGPAGGALAVQRMARATKYPNLLGVDMGGTSTDISFIRDGEVSMTTEAEIAQRPVKLPMIEINTIGSGAGSIAWLDEAGGLHVGPRSAGSDPGPVAYGRGGTEPTVSDANIVLGRLMPESFASGQIKLDVEASKKAILEKIGKPLGMTQEEAALGIIRIANSNMERAVRISSAEKGYDPRTIMLVAFGGAGPMHAAALAKSVGIPTVLAPKQPGVFSAVGMVMADIRHDFVQTRVMRGADISLKSLKLLYAELEKNGRLMLESDGVPSTRQTISRTADVRYVGQAYEINIPLSDGPLSADSIIEMQNRFHAMHEQLYAHHHPAKDIEFVSGRLTAIGSMNAPAMAGDKPNGTTAEACATHRVYFEEAADFVDTPVFDRDTLGPGVKLDGPAIVTQTDTTTVIHPGQSVIVDDFSNLLIATGVSENAR